MESGGQEGRPRAYTVRIITKDHGKQQESRKGSSNADKKEGDGRADRRAEEVYETITQGTSLRHRSSEERIELLHTTLNKVGLAEVLAEGHIRQLGLLLLHGQEPILYGVLDDILDSRDRFRLTQTMLHGEEMTRRSVEKQAQAQRGYARYDLPPDSRPQDS